MKLPFGPTALPAPDPFYVGLIALISQISESLTSAGAILATNSISHPRVPRGALLPEHMPISLVPVNGPRIEVDFSAGEIQSCADGVFTPAIWAKIGTYVEEFGKFRSGPDRNVGKKYSGRLPPRAAGEQDDRASA